MQQIPTALGATDLSVRCSTSLSASLPHSGSHSGPSPRLGLHRAGGVRHRPLHSEPAAVSPCVSSRQMMFSYSSRWKRSNVIYVNIKLVHSLTHSYIVDLTAHWLAGSTNIKAQFDSTPSKCRQNCCHQVRRSRQNHTSTTRLNWVLLAFLSPWLARAACAALTLPYWLWRAWCYRGCDYRYDCIRRRTLSSKHSQDCAHVGVCFSALQKC